MRSSDLHVYDTTLRDGAQQEGLNLSVADKLAIAGHLDELGVGFIEGGWPGANPKDTEFFAARPGASSTCATPRSRRSAPPAGPAARRRRPAGAGSARLRARRSSRSSRSRTRGHVERALRTTLDENLEMVRDTVSFLRRRGPAGLPRRRALLRRLAADRDYALEAVRVATEAGAEVVALCDTNGGMLPGQVADVVADVVAPTGARLGIHCHNDTGCAVANSLAAVDAGATHVQGTVNGYGERTGNADLLTVVAEPPAQAGPPLLDADRLREATRIAHAISEITNVPPYSRQPYVGASAFAHKAGLHASAIKVDPDLYQHTDPRHVGNDMRMLVSDMAGRASIELKGRELGSTSTGQDELLGRVLGAVKELELRGYTFDAADASFELLLRDEARRGGRTTSRSSRGGSSPTPAATTTPSPRRRSSCVAGGERVVATGEGNGPVNALDHALRSGARRGLPRDRQARADRLPGAHPRRRRTAPTRSPGCSSRPPTARRPGRRSASRPTSSRPPGTPWSTGSPTVWCAPASLFDSPS